MDQQSPDKNDSDQDLEYMQLALQRYQSKNSDHSCDSPRYFGREINEYELNLNIWNRIQKLEAANSSILVDNFEEFDQLELSKLKQFYSINLQKNESLQINAIEEVPMQKYSQSLGSNKKQDSFEESKDFDDTTILDKDFYNLDGFGINLYPEQTIISKQHVNLSKQLLELTINNENQQNNNKQVSTQFQCDHTVTTCKNQTYNQKINKYYQQLEDLRKELHVVISDEDERIKYWNIQFSLTDQNQIGQGSFGQVYQAYHQDDNKFKCIKIIQIQNEFDEEQILMEYLYLKLCKEIEQKRVVKIYDAFFVEKENQRFFYIVKLFSKNQLNSNQIMQKCACSLKHIIKERSIKLIYYSDTEQIEIARQLVSSLYFLQKDVNLVHLDIKLNNILFDINSKWFSYLLCDLGTSQFIDQDYHDTCGTILFMSPEMYESYSNNKELKGDITKHDVYSLGLVLICLRYLIYGKNHREDMQIEINKLNEEADQGNVYCKIIQSMLQNDHQERSSFTQLHEDFNINFPTWNNPPIERQFVRQIYNEDPLLQLSKLLKNQDNFWMIFKMITSMKHKFTHKFPNWEEDFLEMNLIYHDKLKKWKKYEIREKGQSIVKVVKIWEKYGKKHLISMIVKENMRKICNHYDTFERIWMNSKKFKLDYQRKKNNIFEKVKILDYFTFFMKINNLNLEDHKNPKRSSIAILFSKPKSNLSKEIALRHRNIQPKHIILYDNEKFKINVPNIVILNKKLSYGIQQHESIRKAGKILFFCMCLDISFFPQNNQVNIPSQSFQQADDEDILNSQSFINLDESVQIDQEENFGLEVLFRQKEEFDIEYLRAQRFISLDGQKEIYGEFLIEITKEMLRQKQNNIDFKYLYQKLRKYQKEINDY